MVGCAVILCTSCSLKEEVHINANKSIDRNMEFHLDNEASQKMVAMAAMAGQQESLKLESIPHLWDTLSAAMVAHVKEIPGAKANFTHWDTASYTGKMNFSLPDMATYNDFASSSFSLPSEASDKVPLGGMKKQQMEWHGQDTLLIHLDNSKKEGTEIPNQAEVAQSMNMVKLMLGIESLMSYKATFFLPRAAKAVEGEGATLAADKKTVTIEKSLDSPNEAGAPDNIKVIF